MKKLGSLLVSLGILSTPVISYSSTKDEEVLKLLQKLVKEIEELKQENKQLKQEVEKLKAQQKVEVGELKEVKKEEISSGFFSKGAYGASKSKIDFYGFVKGDLIWQDSSSVGTIYLLWALPKKIGKHDSTSTITFRHSRFGFDLTKPYKNFLLKGKFEMDFYTQSDDITNKPWNPEHAPLRARLAYLEIIKDPWELRVGHDWMTISQIYPFLSNFPAGSYMGNLGYRATQIRLTRKFKLSEKDLLRFQIALERAYNFGNLGNIVTFDNDPNNEYGKPGIESRLAYETKLFEKPFLLAIYGHVSGQEYKKNYALNHGDIKSTSFSTGVELVLPIPIFKRYNPVISGELWYGQNLAGYYTGGINQGVRFKYTDNINYYYTTDLRNFDRNKHSIISVTPVHAKGGWIELALEPIPKKLKTHFGFGIDDPLDNALKYVKGARLKQQMYYAHFLYRFVPELGAGFEYLRVKTDYRKTEGDDGLVNRLMLSFYYYF